MNKIKKIALGFMLSSSVMCLSYSAHAKKNYVTYINNVPLSQVQDFSGLTGVQLLNITDVDLSKLSAKQLKAYTLAVNKAIQKNPSLKARAEIKLQKVKRIQNAVSQLKYTATPVVYHTNNNHEYHEDTKIKAEQFSSEKYTANTKHDKAIRAYVDDWNKIGSILKSAGITYTQYDSIFNNWDNHQKDHTINMNNAPASVFKDLFSISDTDAEKLANLNKDQVKFSVVSNAIEGIAHVDSIINTLIKDIENHYSINDAVDDATSNGDPVDRIINKKLLLMELKKIQESGTITADSLNKLKSEYLKLNTELEAKDDELFKGKITKIALEDFYAFYLDSLDEFQLNLNYNVIAGINIDEGDEPEILDDDMEEGDEPIIDEVSLPVVAKTTVYYNFNNTSHHHKKRHTNTHHHNSNTHHNYNHKTFTHYKKNKLQKSNAVHTNAVHTNAVHTNALHKSKMHTKKYKTKHNNTGDKRSGK